MQDEAAAFAHVESIVWPDGPACPHCGDCGNVYVLTGVRPRPSQKNPEGMERHGLKKCAECRKQFIVRIGTIFEESHIPLHKWLQAIHLMVSSKKGISSHQLPRVLETTPMRAWFMSHRIRETMRSDGALSFGNFTTHIKGDYGRGTVHTNRTEGYFSIFKRGMKGVCQHCGKKHLHPSAAEFEFRYNNHAGNGVDAAVRAQVALHSIVGKQVLFRDSSGASIDRRRHRLGEISDQVRAKQRA